MNSRRIVVGLSLSVMLTACASRYTPDPRPAEASSIPTFAPQLTVTLLNGQPSKEVVPIGPLAKGSMNAWTESAVRSIRQSLESKGVKVADGASKALQVSVTSAIINPTAGGFGANCIVNVTVEPRGGQPVNLMGNRAGAKYNGCEAAMADIARDALNHAAIRQYLNE